MKNPKLSSKDLKMNCSQLPNVCLSTIRNILRKYGLYGRVAAKKPKLNMMQIRKRVQWWKSYLKAPLDLWKNIIFSECKIELHQNRREYVRRPINSRYQSKYTTKTVKFSSKSIMVWGMIKENGERYLVKNNSNIDSVEYQRILKFIF